MTLTTGLENICHLIEQIRTISVEEELLLKTNPEKIIIIIKVEISQLMQKTFYGFLSKR